MRADVIIDYKIQDFEAILKDYDLVLNSQENKILEKSLNVLKKTGKVISISGPPTPAFVKEIGASWIIKFVLMMISLGITKKAKKRGVNYKFLLMRADGEQLSEITKLIESGVIKPVVDKVFPFEETSRLWNMWKVGGRKGKLS